MLAELSKSIVGRQIKKDRIKEEDRALYEYAYELLLNQTINILIAVLTAVLFRDPVTVLLFLVSYMPLRSYCGGYHADTNMGCTIVSTLLIIMVCCVMNYVKSGWILSYYPIAFAVSAAVIIWCAPVADMHKPLDGAETACYRKRSRIVCGIEILFAMVLYFAKIRYGLVVAVSHLILAFMLFLGILKNRKRHVV